ncbi:MAG: hypothetical protein ACXQS8_03115 [Candidatus Helarchaeales archaeon]
MRNSAAHPNLIKVVPWDLYLNALKEMIGKPPRKILYKILKYTRLI